MKKKLILSSIVIASIVALYSIISFVDFTRFKSGKTPIFAFHVFTSFIQGEGEELKESSYHFKGIGYSINSCDKEKFEFRFGHVDIQCFDVEIG